MAFQRSPGVFLLLSVFYPRYSCCTERAWQFPESTGVSLEYLNLGSDRFCICAFPLGISLSPELCCNMLVHQLGLRYFSLEPTEDSRLLFDFIFCEMELQLKSTCDTGHFSLQIQNKIMKQLYAVQSKLMPLHDSEAGWFIAAENPHTSGNNIKLSPFNNFYCFGISFSHVQQSWWCLNFLVMEAGKAGIIGALPCVISSDKLHINLAVETRAHSPLYKHLSHLCQIIGFVFYVWLPSNTVMAVRDAGKNMKENTNGAWTHMTEDLSLVPCHEEKIISTTVAAEVHNRVTHSWKSPSSFSEIKATDNMPGQKLLKRMKQSRQVVDL